jgi:hypothetical protein
MSEPTCLDMTVSARVARAEWHAVIDDLAAPMPKRHAYEQRFEILQKLERGTRFAVMPQVSWTPKTVIVTGMKADGFDRPSRPALVTPPPRPDPVKAERVEVGGRKSEVGGDVGARAPRADGHAVAGVATEREKKPAPLVVPSPALAKHLEKQRKMPPEAKPTPSTTTTTTMTPKAEIKPRTDNRARAGKPPAIDYEEQKLISGRMMAALEQLGYLAKHGAQAAAIRKSGISDAVWSTAVRRGNGVTPTVVEKFATALGVNAEWLVTGKGEMLSVAQEVGGQKSEVGRDVGADAPRADGHAVAGVATQTGGRAGARRSQEGTAAAPTVEIAQEARDQAIQRCVDGAAVRAPGLGHPPNGPGRVASTEPALRLGEEMLEAIQALERAKRRVRELVEQVNLLVRSA